MARIDHLFTAPKLLLAVGVSFGLFSAGARAAANPRCLDSLRKDRIGILERFGKLQNYKTYTPQKAAELHKRIEAYLLSIGSVFQNFKFDAFFAGEAAKLPEMRSLSVSEKAKLAEILAPAFESRRLPAYRDFATKLRDAGLARLPARRLLETMDRSFKMWRTKLVFDRVGETTYNKLVRAFSKNPEFGEISMEVGILGKNEWEAFFEAEKGRAIFNPDLPGVLEDRLTSTGVHEAVHMIVETLAAQGHDSPYAVWVKVEKRLKKTGAIGSHQKRALSEAADPLSDGDYYRNELYLDEVPAHAIQAAIANVQLSKTLRERFHAFIEPVKKSAIKDELDDAFADYVRSGEIEWDEYSSETKRVFEDFLKTKADDGRTRLSRQIRELHEYLNAIDLINDTGSTAVADARAILLEAVDAAGARGRKGIDPADSETIAILPDNFLGEKGFKVRIMIPVDVLQKDGTYKRVPRGAAVNFRYTNDGKISERITPQKITRLLDRMDWVDELAEKIRLKTEEYAFFLDENRELKDYTFADVFRIKSIHTRIRQDMRETLERIRASK